MNWKVLIAIMIFFTAFLWVKGHFSQSYRYTSFEDEDIQDAIVGITDKVLNEGCVLVFISDDSLPFGVSDSLIPKLQQNGGRTLLIFNLKSDDLENRFDSQVRQISCFLHNLYRISRCYIFIIWIHDLRVLYPSTTNIHPGWRPLDIVIFASHHIGRSYHKHWTKYRFWAAIPNILGLRRPRPSIEQSNRIVIFTVLPYATKSGPQFKEVDVWLVPQKKFERNAILLWDKFTSFNGATLRYAILWKSPYFIFGDEANPFVDGIDWRLLRLVYKQLDFSFNTSVVESTLWSGNRHHGNWSGAFGFLQSGKVDLAVGGLSKSGQRLSDFDFTASYYGDAYVFISPITTAEPIVGDLFASPLNPEVWQSLMLTSIGLAIALKILARLERSFWNQPGTGQYPDHHFTSFLHNIYFMYNTFCQKPFPHVPFSNALKLPFIGTSLSITILGSVFGGCLFSQLFDARNITSIDNLNGIVNSRLPVCVMNYDGILNYGVSKTRRVSLTRLWKNATMGNITSSIGCIEEVIRGKMIYIDTYTRLHFVGRLRYLGANGIKFHFARERLLYQTNIGWASRKRWPFLPKISQVLSRAVESGLVDYWMSTFMRGKFGWDEESLNIFLDLGPYLASQVGPRLPDSTKNLDPTRTLSWDHRFIKLGFFQFGTVYQMWVQGMALGVLAFIGELLMQWTWMTVLFSKRMYRRIVQVLRIRHLEQQLRAFAPFKEDGLRKSSTIQKLFRVTPFRRQLTEVRRYFVWNDLTPGNPDTILPSKIKHSKF